MQIKQLENKDFGFAENSSHVAKTECSKLESRELGGSRHMFPIVYNSSFFPLEKMLNEIEMFQSDLEKKMYTEVATLQGQPNRRVWLAKRRDKARAI